MPFKGRTSLNLPVVLFHVLRDCVGDFVLIVLSQCAPHAADRVQAVSNPITIENASMLSCRDGRTK
jgi:hypothetical protein